ncbi:MAG: hypothetical protein ACP5M0_03745 [Desulfomonilaceae bacterium]
MTDRVRHDKSGAMTQTLKVIIFTPRCASFRQRFRAGVQDEARRDHYDVHTGLT